MNKWTIYSRVATIAALLALAFMAPAALSEGEDDDAQPAVEMDWSSFSDSVIAARDRCVAAAATADEKLEADQTAAEQARDVTLARAEDAVVEAFDKAIKTATRREKDDEVVALEEAKGYLLDPPAAGDAPDPSMAVLGAWRFTFAGGTSESFVFFRDGKIKDQSTFGTEHSGSWSVDATHVNIRWTDGIWAVMRLPLDFSGTVGDDCYGLEVFIAVKLDEEGGEDDVDWDDLPKAVQRARKKYDKAVAEALEDYDDATASAERAHDKALREAIRPLLKELDKAMKAAEKEDDADTMADIAEAIRHVKTTMGPRSAADIVLGMWTSEAGRWKFLENGSVAIEYRTGSTDVGQWRLTEDYVSVVWTAMIPRDSSGSLMRRAPVVRRTPTGMTRSMGRVPSLDASLPVPWAIRKRNGGPRWSALRLPLDEAGTTVDSWEGMADTTIAKQDETGD